MTGRHPNTKPAAFARPRWRELRLSQVSMVDDGGIDTLDNSQTANAQQIWLEPELFSNVLGRTGNRQPNDRARHGD